MTVPSIDAAVPGETVTIDRSRPVPGICILTGERTSKHIRCLFHWKTTPFHAGIGPIEALIEGLRFYFQDVPKAVLQVPVSESLYRRRNAAIVLIGVAVLATVATCLGLLFGQQWIDAMPKGPQKKQLNDLLIPALAFGGFGIIAPCALLAGRWMPGLTTKLKVEEITATHIRLSGVCTEFRQALEAT
jgi:hypothetical protein